LFHGLVFFGLVLVFDFFELFHPIDIQAFGDFGYFIQVDPAGQAEQYEFIGGTDE